MLVFLLSVLLPMTSNITKSELKQIGWIITTDFILEEVNNALHIYNTVENHKRAINFLAHASYESGCGRWIKNVTSCSFDKQFSFQEFGKRWKDLGINSIIDNDQTDITISNVLYNSSVGYENRHRLFSIVFLIFIKNQKIAKG